MDASSPFSPLLENLYFIFPIVLISLFIGSLGGIYIEEWLPKTNWIHYGIKAIASILADFPSILYGFLGLEVLVFRGGEWRFVVRALTFVLIVMPITFQSTQQAIQRIDTPLREAAYALGSNRWQMLVTQIFPLAWCGISAGICRAISRTLAIVGMLIGIQTIITTTVPMRVFHSATGEIGAVLGGAMAFSCVATLLERYSQKRFT